MARINDEASLPTTPTTGDVFAIESGGTTYKIDYNALATAIVNALAVKKTGDTMTGDLQINKSLPAVYLATSGNTRAYMRYNGTGKYLQLVQYNPDNGKYENYCFPVANDEANSSYNILTSKIPVTIAQGGSGQTTEAGMRGVVFNSSATSGITSYPTTPGLYRVTTSCAGLPSGATYYGVLAIFGAGTYYMHIFASSDNSLYYAYKGSSGAPAKWYKVTGTAINPVT